MQPEKVQMLDETYEMYLSLLKNIEKIYEVSEEYMITSKDSLNNVLDNAKQYMYEVFKCIINASNGISEEEKAFIEKIEVPGKTDVNADDIIEGIFGKVPMYIELANNIDKLAETSYAKEFIKDTLAICKKVMDIDGNTYADESSFTYSFVDMLEKYIKGK